MASDGDNNGSTADPKLRDPAVLAIAVVVLIALAAFIAYLLRNLGLPKDEWERAIYLLTGVESVAFAAAGYVFAAQVQRAQVKEANAEAAKGEVLAVEIQKKAAAARPRKGEDFTTSGVTAPGNALQDLSRTASLLFPRSAAAVPPGELP